MIELIIFLLLGMAAGIILGLVPGLHPNMVALVVPFIAMLNAEPLSLIVFAVALGVSNTFLDFIPSMLLGAPEAGTELTVLPAHRMLLEGNGYDAIKLAVVGGIGSVVLMLFLLPLIIFSIPVIYEIIRPFTYALLMFIVILIILSEKGPKKIALASFCFLAAGSVGLLSGGLNVDRNLLLFPMLSGLFGVSTLLVSSRSKIKIENRRKEVILSSRQRNRAVVFGSLGGIFSGMLPGIGASEIATMASADKNEKSFLMTVGAVTISNTLMAMLSLWLIGKARSGVAVFIGQISDIGFNEFLIIFFAGLAVAGVSAVITLMLARTFLKKIETADYSKINLSVVAVIALMTLVFTGLYGLLLLVTCTSLGLFTNKIGVRRSVLMGVLILPTILFYLPM